MSTRDELREALERIRDWQTHGALLGRDADAMLELARAALATPPEPLDVERWMTARHTALHPQRVYGGEGCACPEERESVIAIAAEYARLSAPEGAPGETRS